jgi:very-short-patch-repair endonuclease
MLPVIRAAGVPRPLFNHPVGVPGRTDPLIVDLLWPDLRLVVELDSQRWHGDWQQAEIDRDRDQLLALAGHLCHRFVRRKVEGNPAGSAKRLRALVALRGRELNRA